VTSPPTTAPASASTRALLRDGTPALLERLGPAHVDEVLALHERLPDQDRYLRFTTLHPADLGGTSGGRSTRPVGP
jgi:hypothetical protein